MVNIGDVSSFFFQGNEAFVNMNPMLSYVPTNYVASNIPGELRMLDVLRNRLRDSREITISVSFLRYSGLGLIVDDLKTFVERGGRARILTSTYLGITQPEALQQLSKIAVLSVVYMLPVLQIYHQQKVILVSIQNCSYLKMGTKNVG